MDIVKRAESVAKERLKETYKADKLGEDGRFILVNMTNSSVTDGFDRPVLAFDKRTNTEKLVYLGELYFDPIEGLDLNKLVWKSI